MSVLKLMSCGIVAAVLLPLCMALFVVISLLAFIQSFPGPAVAQAAMDHFLSGEKQTTLVDCPSVEWQRAKALETLQPYESYLRAASARHGVSPNLVRAVILVESGGNAMAVSPKGAAGLMQLMPATFVAMGYDQADIYKPGLNVEAGVRYLAQSLAAFEGDTYWAAAAYNAGIAQARHLKERYGYVPAWFAGGETRRYVEGVLALKEKLGGE